MPLAGPHCSCSTPPRRSRVSSTASATPREARCSCERSSVSCRSSKLRCYYRMNQYLCMIMFYILALLITKKNYHFTLLLFCTLLNIKFQLKFHAIIIIRRRFVTIVVLNLVNVINVVVCKEAPLSFLLYVQYTNPCCTDCDDIRKQLLCLDL